MASSEPPSAEQIIENLINSRNRDLSFLLPFFQSLNSVNVQAFPNQGTGELPDRIIFVNPLTQGMVVMSSSSSPPFPGFDELGKRGQPPASKASIDALQTVEMDVSGGCDQCVVCLEEWKEGDKAKEMPCKHKFHEECIGKWLRVHGSCPVCRYEMPVEEKKESESGEGRRESWVWVTFGGSGRRSSDQDSGSDES